MGGKPSQKRVLLIAYYFPPLGGAGVGRPLALARYLPDHGIACDILTVKPIAYHIHEPELLDGLDPLTIHRSGSHDPQRLLHLLGRSHSRGGESMLLRDRAWRIFPDTKKGWIASATKLGRRLLLRHHYDAIISTSPPISAHLIARQLVEESGVRWIADFRDPWTSHRIESWFSSTELQTRAWEIIKDIRARATALVTTNRSTTDYLDCDHTIPNGFDPNTATRWQSPTDRSVFTIGLLGTLDSIYPVEPLTTWLAQLHQETPELCGRMKIVQVGRCDESSVTNAIRTAAPNIEIVCHGLRSRSETVSLLNESVALYVGIDPKIGIGLTPGRIFEMLASGRKLLVAATPDSDVAGIIRDTECGWFFDPRAKESVAVAAASLRQAVQDWLNGNMTIECPPLYAESFSYRQVAKRFAELILKP